jgi:large subunit ribosomal protein L24
MKLKRDDKVVVILGKDKGKTGTVLAVLPAQNKVLVENINVVKKHTKPSQKLPRGGILDVTKPIDVSKVMVLDPASGKPARVGYQIKPDGSKERIFKVSSNYDRAAKKPETDKPKKTEVESKPKPKAKAKTPAAPKAGDK